MAYVPLFENLIDDQPYQEIKKFKVSLCTDIGLFSSPKSSVNNDHWDRVFFQLSINLGLYERDILMYKKTSFRFDLLYFDPQRDGIEILSEGNVDIGELVTLTGLGHKMHRLKVFRNAPHSLHHRKQPITIIISTPALECGRLPARTIQPINGELVLEDIYWTPLPSMISQFVSLRFDKHYWSAHGEYSDQGYLMELQLRRLEPFDHFNYKRKEVRLIFRPGYQDAWEEFCDQLYSHQRIVSCHSSAYHYLMQGLTVLLYLVVLALFILCLVLYLDIWERPSYARK